MWYILRGGLGLGKENRWARKLRAMCIRLTKIEKKRKKNDNPTKQTNPSSKQESSSQE